MDFIIGLSKKVKQHDSVMVIFEKLAKVAHVIPIKSKYLTSDMAQELIRYVVGLHGDPKKIVSNKGVKFTFNFLKEFFMKPTHKKIEKINQ